MSIRVALRHVTTYRYSRPVWLSPHLFRLRPAPHTRTPVDGYRLAIEPADHLVHWQRDPSANRLARVVFQHPTDRLRVTVDLTADLAPQNPFDFLLDPTAEQWPVRYAAEDAPELAPFLEPSDLGPEVIEWISANRPNDTATIGLLTHLNQALANAVEYEVRLDPGVQTPEQTLARGIGSCRDTSWLLVQVLRHLGFAARFTSGYLIQLKSDVPDEPKPVKADHADLHAWCEVYLPGAGWIGLDPTSGYLCAEGHIPLAAAPMPDRVAPIEGTHEPCSVEFSHDFTLRRLADPTVFNGSAVKRHRAGRRPYSAAQWKAVEALAKRVDGALRDGDVRLTMGGEPTFVSADDRESAHWHYAALGPGKRAHAETLLRELARRFAGDAGPLLHFGLGKHYPGEPLPRWALGCHWRTDGKPIWRDHSLLSATSADADPRAFLTELAATLGLPDPQIVAAHEDPYFGLWRERGLPADLEPGDARLADADQRRRLARWLDEAGLRDPVAWVLPLRSGAGGGEPAWITARWQLRGVALFLISAEWPAGDRIPYASLPLAEYQNHQTTVPADPFERLPDLPDAPSRSGGAHGATVSAVTAERRDGALHLHLPRIGELEAYLALLDAIERTAARLGTGLVLEGAPPPRDPRLRHFTVTPDPGVVEVNVHPAADWAELVKINREVYEAAEHCGLSAEKYHRDGRPVGTGGGNHLTLGGPSPADSPFLRRPDLLRSILSYWNNHPALSYLFAGLYVGPTSQAPRVDEAREDALDELEIAFRQIPSHGADAIPPWLTDRLFRNLLVDVTGNTHRAEFCIDKLYAPDQPGGRQGLVEMRGVEMPTTPELGLVQMLLVRALIARFWREPYTAPLTRWGRDLHDRYLLPHYVEADLAAVLHELADWGFAFEPDWFLQQLEQRFPVLGRIEADGIVLELRQALEPWPVLGEQMTASGTSRTVDPSMDRIQIAAHGLPPQHAVGVNGVALPLVTVGPGDRQIAGVRYRAWAPPQRLHPTVPVHAPLRIDLVDTASGKRVAGCWLQVGPAAGSVPADAKTAEAARLGRVMVTDDQPDATTLLSSDDADTDRSRITFDLRRIG